MPNVVVRPVKIEADQKDFLGLPETLYQDDENWIPGCDQQDRELAGWGTHPFYETADAMSFVATRNGNPCGRITAIINRSYNEFHNVRHGFFGFFESTPDPDVTNGLIDAASQWLISRECTLLRGPVSPSMTYQCGLLVNGFSESPSYLMPYNPACYQELLEDRGLKKCQDLYSYSGSVGMLDRVNPKIASTYRKVTQRLGLELRHFRMEQFTAEIRTFYDVYHQSLTGMWGFTPLNDQEIRHAGTTLSWMTLPQFTVMAEVRGQAIGSVLGILDYNPLIKMAGHHFSETEMTSFLNGPHRPRRLRIPCTLVTPEFTLWGVGPAMLHFLFDTGIQWGLREVEFSWVAESNWLSRKSLERGGARLTRTFRVYELPLG